MKIKVGHIISEAVNSIKGIDIQMLFEEYITVKIFIQYKDPPRKSFTGWPKNTSTSSTLGIKQFIKGDLSTFPKDNVLSQAKRKFPSMIKNGASDTNDLLGGLAQVKDSKYMGHGKGKWIHVSSLPAFYFSKIKLDQLFYLIL